MRKRATSCNLWHSAAARGGKLAVAISARAFHVISMAVLFSYIVGMLTAFTLFNLLCVPRFVATARRPDQTLCARQHGWSNPSLGRVNGANLSSVPRHRFHPTTCRADWAWDHYRNADYFYFWHNFRFSKAAEPVGIALIRIEDFVVTRRLI
jgi:hypothetical protein